MQRGQDARRRQFEESTSAAVRVKVARSAAAIKRDPIEIPVERLHQRSDRLRALATTTLRAEVIDCGRCTI